MARGLRVAEIEIGEVHVIEVENDKFKIEGRKTSRNVC